MRKVARGRQLAREHIARLLPVAADIAQQLGRPSTLAIVAGDDAASRRFVQVKQDALSDLDLNLEIVWLAAAARTEDALSAVARLNSRADVDALFLQFPLPAGINAEAAANALSPAKDVDCSSETVHREFLAGRAAFAPAAPQAARDLLAAQLGSLNAAAILPCGDDVFTQALEVLLPGAGATVDAAPADAAAMVVTNTLPQADLYASIQRLPVLLDAGYYLPPRADDWLPEAWQRRIGVLLTQYGNVGPLTVAYLAEGTLRAARRNLSDQPSDSGIAARWKAPL